MKDHSKLFFPEIFMKTQHLVRAILLSLSLTAPLMSPAQAQNANPAVQPAGRVGIVVNIPQETIQNAGSTLGTVGGAVVGNRMTSGSSTALDDVDVCDETHVFGNSMTSSSSTVWVVTVHYEDGTLANIQLASQPHLRTGDHVRVTDGGLKLLP
jgi:hypothetical protein